MDKPRICEYVSHLPQETPNLYEEIQLRQNAEAAENNRRNLRAAHMFVAIIIGIIGLSYIFAIVYPAIACKDVKIPNEVLSILQAALFTLLGYLFGEKNSNGKSI